MTNPPNGDIPPDSAHSAQSLTDFVEFYANQLVRRSAVWPDSMMRETKALIDCCARVRKIHRAQAKRPGSAKLVAYMARTAKRIGTLSKNEEAKYQNFLQVKRLETFNPFPKVLEATATPGEIPATAPIPPQLAAISQRIARLATFE